MGDVKSKVRGRDQDNCSFAGHIFSIEIMHAGVALRKGFLLTHEASRTFTTSSVCIA